MKKSFPLTTLVPFPVPEGVAATVADSPPVIGAFPTGDRSCGMIGVAVPVLLTMGACDDVSGSQAIGEAVGALRKSKLYLGQMDGTGEELLSEADFMILANSDRPHSLPCPDTRDEFLALLGSAARRICGRMARQGRRDVEAVADEVGSVLDLMRCAGAAGNTR
jgi:hypothetical protein